MGIPIDSILNTVKLGASVRGEADVSVRVAVFVDATATPFLIDAIREAFVPQTTSALVRVERLGEAPASAKDDTDVSIVLSCGSVRLQEHVRSLWSVVRRSWCFRNQASKFRSFAMTHACSA